MWNDRPVCLSCISPFNWGSCASCGSDLLPVAAGNYSHSVCVSAWWMTPAPVEQSLPGALLFFFLTFAWEPTVCIPEPKPTQIIISSVWCMIFSLWKTSYRTTWNVFLPIRRWQYWCYQWGYLLGHSSWIRDDAALSNTRPHCSYHMFFLSNTRNKSQIPRLLKPCLWRQLCNKKTRRWIKIICCHSIKSHCSSLFSTVHVSWLRMHLW